MQFPASLPSAIFSTAYPLVNADKIAVGLENRRTKTLPFPSIVQSPAIIESRNKDLPQNPLPTSPNSRPASIPGGGNENAAEIRINQGQSVEAIIASASRSADETKGEFTPAKTEVIEQPQQDSLDAKQREALLQIQNQQLIRQLRVRDREVRTHEAAHAAAGAELAGAPSYSYQKGPDGRNYAVGGEVAIDTSSVQGKPEVTLVRAEKVRRAALAPLRPSAQDMHVATLASRMAIDARAQISAQKSQELVADTAASGEKKSGLEDYISVSEGDNDVSVVGGNIEKTV